MPCVGRARGGTGGMRGKSVHLMITGAVHSMPVELPPRGVPEERPRGADNEGACKRVGARRHGLGGFVIGKGRPLLCRQLYSGNPGSRLAQTSCGCRAGLPVRTCPFTSSSGVFASMYRGRRVSKAVMPWNRSDWLTAQDSIGLCTHQNRNARRSLCSISEFNSGFVVGRRPPN